MGAEAPAVSMGAANYCLKASVEKGLVELNNPQKNPNNSSYLCLLTPTGTPAKGQFTAIFLGRIIRNYEELRSEIDKVQDQVDGLPG